MTALRLWPVRLRRSGATACAPHRQRPGAGVPGPADTAVKSVDKSVRSWCVIGSRNACRPLQARPYNDCRQLANEAASTAFTAADVESCACALHICWRDHLICVSVSELLGSSATIVRTVRTGGNVRGTAGRQPQLQGSRTRSRHVPTCAGDDQLQLQLLRSIQKRH